MTQVRLSVHQTTIERAKADRYTEWVSYEAGNVTLFPNNRPATEINVTLYSSHDKPVKLHVAYYYGGHAGLGIASLKACEIAIDIANALDVPLIEPEDVRYMNSVASTELEPLLDKPAIKHVIDVLNSVYSPVNPMFTYKNGMFYKITDPDGSFDLLDLISGTDIAWAFQTYHWLNEVN